MTRSSHRWTLRVATPDDQEAIVDIWHRGWRDAHLGRVPAALLPHRRPADVRSLVPARLSSTTVAEIDSSPVGFVVVKEDEVEQIYVNPSARRTGVAAALLRHAEEVIATHYGRAWLAVVAGNTRARSFYQRNGWSDGGDVNYYAPPPPAAQRKSRSIVMRSPSAEARKKVLLTFPWIMTWGKMIRRDSSEENRDGHPALAHPCGSSHQHRGYTRSPPSLH